MTEKQGGSDVRANTTRAEPVGDGWYELHGHKWFCSYPPCDIFLVLAQAPAGLSCFVLERGAGDGVPAPQGQARHALAAVLGGRVPRRRGAAAGRGGPRRGDDHRDGHAHAAGLRDRQSRPGCAAASRRRSGTRAIASAFGARLVEQPAMVNVLADLALESEAATATALRLARAYDEGDTALRRFATAIAKYWVCKRATPHAVEALECLGGNGYVEESPMPRLLRDAPLNGIWEGSGQRDRARRPARAVARARRAGGVRRRVRAGARRRTRRWTRTSTRCRRTSIRGARGGRSRSSRWRSRRRCWCGTRRRSSPTRSAPRGSAAAGGSTARCRRAWTAPRSSRARARDRLSTWSARARKPSAA